LKRETKKTEILRRATQGRERVKTQKKKKKKRQKLKF